MNYYKHKESESIVEFDRTQNGRVYFFQQGGGFECSVKREKFEKEFIKVDDDIFTKYKPATFQIDAYEETFKGYTTGEKWNGWGKPVFESYVADEIICINPDMGIDHMGYFIIDDGKKTYLERMTIWVDGKEIKVISFEHLGWTWSEK